MAEKVTPLPLKALEPPSPFPEANLSNPTVVRILFAAAECFAKGGYQGTTTKEIAAAAGVSKSLLHYHFQSKEHILLELEAMIFRTVVSRVQSFSMRGTPGIEQALSALDDTWNLAKSVRKYIPLVIDFWKLSESQPFFRSHQESVAAQVFQFLTDVIALLLGPDVKKLTMPPERVAELLLSTIPGFVIRLYIDPEGVDRAFEDYKNLLRKLVDAPPPAA
ncbi:MAG: TetR/AcrR family transcriptional regulator [Bdellovibrionota bacterium]